MKPILPGLRRTLDDDEIYRSRFLIAVTVTLAAALELVDSSIVNVAIPHMMGTLGATLDEIAWVSTGYVVANVIVLPISGWLANYFGRRNYFALSIFVFIVSSMLCGAATSLPMLVFWRIVQGLGGGGLISTAQATIYETFPRKEIGTGMAIFGMGIMVGPSIGPTVGGYITDALSWPWIFYVNLPIGAIALVAALMLVPDSKHGQRAETVDYMGLLLLAVGIGTLQTMLERGERLDWFDSREVIAYAIVSITALTAFVWQELRHEHPVVDVRIMADTQFSASLVFGFIVGIILYATVFVFPVYVQTLMGYPAWTTGLVILPGAVASGVTMAILGRKAPTIKIDLRLLVVVGVTIYAYGMWRMGHFTTDSGGWDFLIPMTLRGIGLGFIFIPLNALALGNLKPAQMPGGSGLYNLTRQLGGSVGIAVAATLFVKWEKQNRAELARHVSVYADATQARLAELKGLVISHGAPPVMAGRRALAILDLQVGKQAAMVAFADLFWLIGITIAAALPLLLLMRSRPSAEGIPDAH